MCRFQTKSLLVDIYVRRIVTKASADSDNLSEFVSDETTKLNSLNTLLKRPKSKRMEPSKNGDNLFNDLTNKDHGHSLRPRKRSKADHTESNQ